MADLGVLTRLEPREVWTHEAHDFTPWLARNLERLGAVLGLDLELEQEEADAGDFSLDILATDLGSNRKVVIENQLYATDHRHLGQLLTYAAHFEASAVVWVTATFRDEHLRTLDWLNRVGGGTTAFFGVVVEVLRIDDSRPAVSFRVVVSPAEWQPSKGKPSAGAGEGTTDRREAYRRFFQGLIDELREKHRFTNAKAGQPQNWYSFSSGVRGLRYGVSFNGDGQIRAALYIDSDDGEVNERAFNSLKSNQAELEKAFGEPLTWEPLENRRACRIAAYRAGSIDDPEETLEQVREWASDRVRRIKAVLTERAKAELTKAGTLEGAVTPLAGTTVAANVTTN